MTIGKYEKAVIKALGHTTKEFYHTSELEHIKRAMQKVDMEFESGKGPPLTEKVRRSRRKRGLEPERVRRSDRVITKKKKKDDPKPMTEKRKRRREDVVTPNKKARHSRKRTRDTDVHERRTRRKMIYFWL